MPEAGQIGPAQRCKGVLGRLVEFVPNGEDLQGVRDLGRDRLEVLHLQGCKRSAAGMPGVEARGRDKISLQKLTSFFASIASF